MEHSQDNKVGGYPKPAQGSGALRPRGIMFTKQQLETWGLPFEIDSKVGKIIEDVKVYTSRWTETRRVVFQLHGQREDQAYAVEYEKGLTEQQWQLPWENMTPCVYKVRRVEVTHFIWKEHARNSNNK